MTIKHFSVSNSKRRGLSSIVGALLFVVLMVSAFAVIGVALNTQSDIASTGRDVAANDLKKSQEDFELNVFADPPSGATAELHIEVRNKGSNPVEISNVIVSEITDIANDYPTTVYDISSDLSFITAGQKDEILAPNQILLELATPPPDLQSYNIKVISALGNIKTHTVICDEFGCTDPGVPPGAGALTESLFLDGPNAIHNKTSTIVMFVTNTSDEVVTDVEPEWSFDGTGTPPCDYLSFYTYDDSTVTVDNGFTEQVVNCKVSPSSPVDLGPHEIAIFKWDVTVQGDIGATFQFCNYAKGNDPLGPITSQPQSCDEVTIIDPNDCDGCGPGGDGGPQILLIDDLLIRPSLFMVIPSPFGQDVGANPIKNKGVWGVNLVNPTEVTMTVNKLTIVSYPPTANDNDSVIPKNCQVNMISPTSNWSCPKENTILWQNLATPVTLPPRSSIEFLVGVEPGAPSANTNIDALIVQSNVYTTLGSFGKAAYQSTMRSGDTAIPNVFLTDNLEDRTSFHGTRNTGLQELDEATFRVSIADMDNADTTYIKSGARLIINVPRLWTGVSIVDSVGFSSATVTTLGDSSTQIIGTTSVNIGGPLVADKDVLTITFKATPPENEICGQKRPYIMYVLADGATATDFPIGPLNEVALVVDPDPGRICN